MAEAEAEARATVSASRRGWTHVRAVAARGGGGQARRVAPVRCGTWLMMR